MLRIVYLGSLAVYFLIVFFASDLIFYIFVSHSFLSFRYSAYEETKVNSNLHEPQYDSQTAMEEDDDDLVQQQQLLQSVAVDLTINTSTSSLTQPTQQHQNNQRGVLGHHELHDSRNDQACTEPTEGPRNTQGSGVHNMPNNRLSQGGSEVTLADCFKKTLYAGGLSTPVLLYELLRTEDIKVRNSCLLQGFFLMYIFYF